MYANVKKWKHETINSFYTSPIECLSELSYTDGCHSGAVEGQDRGLGREREEAAEAAQDGLIRAARGNGDAMGGQAGKQQTVSQNMQWP